jgi:hypothetical protein
MVPGLSADTWALDASLQPDSLLVMQLPPSQPCPSFTLRYFYVEGCDKADLCDLEKGGSPGGSPLAAIGRTMEQEGSGALDRVK